MSAYATLVQIWSQDHTQRQGKLDHLAKLSHWADQCSQCTADIQRILFLKGRKQTMNIMKKWMPLPHLLVRSDRNIGHVQRYKIKWLGK